MHRFASQSDSGTTAKKLADTELFKEINVHTTKPEQARETSFTNRTLF
jgi:hypothetical protein